MHRGGGDGVTGDRCRPHTRRRPHAERGAASGREEVAGPFRRQPWSLAAEVKRASAEHAPTNVIPVKHDIR